MLRLFGQGRRAAAIKRAGPFLLRAEEIAHFHRPVALRLYAVMNVIAAMFYGGLGTYGILALMFAPAHAADRFTFDNMIALLHRSLMHSAIAGVAFIADHVMLQIVRIAALRRAEREETAEAG